MSRPKASTLQVIVFSPVILAGIIWQLVVDWFQVGRMFFRASTGNGTYI